MTNQTHFTIRISSSFGDKKSAEVSGVLNTLSLGMGIFYGWLCLVSIGSAEIFPGLAHRDDDVAGSLYIAFLASYAASLFFVSFSNQKFLKFYTSKQALVVCTAITVLGTALVLVGSLSVGGNSPVVLAAGVIIGIGAALMTVLWGVAFSRFELETVILNTALAIALTGLLYLFISNCPQPAISWTLCLIMPIASSLLLWKQTPIPYYLRNEIPIFHPISVHRFSFIVRFGIPIILFGTSLSVVRLVCMSQVMHKADTTTQLLVIFALITGAVCVALTNILAHKGSHWDVIFRVLTPFVGLGIISLTLFGPAFEPLGKFLLVMGFVCFESLMWIYFSDLSEEFRISPIFLFGLGRGIMAVVALASLGTIVSPATFALAPVASEDATVALLLFLIVLGCSLLPRHRELWPLVKADANNKQAYLALEENADAKARNNNALTAPNPNTLADGTQSQEENADTDDEVARSKGRFRARCEEIADYYLLSRRESEVMFLLAKGHNATYIQEKLYISKSTTKTHINHIYRKLDIHTQQELLRMVDERDTPLDAATAGDETAASTESSPPRIKEHH